MMFCVSGGAQIRTASAIVVPAWAPVQPPYTTRWRFIRGEGRGTVAEPPPLPRGHPSLLPRPGPPQRGRLVVSPSLVVLTWIRPGFRSFDPAGGQHPLDRRVQPAGGVIMHKLPGGDPRHSQNGAHAQDLDQRNGVLKLDTSRRIEARRPGCPCLR